MERDFSRAIELLAGLGNYKGSIDRLLHSLDKLHKKPQREQEHKRIFALHYMLGVAYRDFLICSRDVREYEKLEEWVDNQYGEFDQFFDQELITFEEAELYYQQQMQQLKIRNRR